jgi:hypothetical protein
MKKQFLNTGPSEGTAVEMSELHSSREFSKWEEAAKKEWAVVHAKFYISLPKAQRRWQGPQNRLLKRQRQRRRNKKALERLPPQVAVIDVKAAQNSSQRARICISP